jgi:ParB-like chromosome segregation protein Spo0J
MKNEIVSAGKLRFFPKSFEQELGETFALTPTLFDPRSERPVDKRLKVSLEEVGQREALKVIRVPGFKGEYYVVAGTRRLKALRAIDEGHQVAIEIHDLSLDENWGDIKQLQIDSNFHSPSTPEETAQDVASLREAGMSVSDIAGLYKCSAVQVRNYLALSDTEKVAPEVMAGLRAGHYSVTLAWSWLGLSLKDQTKKAAQAANLFAQKNEGAKTHAEAEAKNEAKAAAIAPKKAANGKVAIVKPEKVKHVTTAEMADRPSLQAKAGKTRKLKTRLNITQILEILDETPNVPPLVNCLAEYVSENQGIDDLLASLGVVYAKDAWFKAFTEKVS